MSTATVDTHDQRPALRPVRTGDADPGRVPPNDQHAEQCVLGAMLMSKDAIADVVETLSADSFYQPKHGIVFSAIVDLYGRGEPADMVTVAHALIEAGTIGRIGGAAYLQTVTSAVPMAANASYYAGIVKDHADGRRLIEAAATVAKEAWASGDLAGRIDRAQQAVHDIVNTRVSGDATFLSELLQPALDQIETLSLADGALLGLPTGYLDLDRILNGLQGGQMVTVAGRPGSGKSTLATGITQHVSIKLGIPTVMFSLEMSKPEIVMRILSAEARVPLHNIRTGSLSDADWTNLARRMGEISEAPLLIDDTANQNMTMIGAKARRLVQQHGIKLAVIDHMGLVEPDDTRATREQQVAGISRRVKLLAKELNIPVIAVHQLNRSSEARTDKRPQLSDLRDSGCMTEDTTLLRADTGAPITFGQLLRDGHDRVQVWSLDEQRRMVPAKLTAVFPSGMKETFRLRLASGREVKASANHPFLRFDGWRRLDQIAVGDRIAIPRITPEPPDAGIGWSDHRLALLAYLIADGTVLPTQPVHITDDDPDVLANAAKAAKEFGITARVVNDEAVRCPALYLPAPFHLTHGVRNPIQAWFREMGICGLRSWEKRIPDVLYSASNAEVAVFLRHLVATDGSITPHKGKTGASVRYDTTSRKLADGVASLLSRFGIVARIRRIAQGKHRDLWTVTIESSADLRTFAARIGAFGRSALRLNLLLDSIKDRAANTNVDTVPREVWEVIKAERYRVGMTERQFQAGLGMSYCGSTLSKSCPSRDRLKRCAEVLDSPVLQSAASDDVFWDRVVAIEPLGEQQVFDATVEGTHNFVADGLVAHNCIEQDSDVVVLVHREDYYDKESARAGEADLVVAKNRNGQTDTVTVAAQLHLARFVDMAVQ